MTPEQLVNLARCGYHLFPVSKSENHRGDRVPLVPWTEESTTDMNVIAAWYARFPDCWWGVDTGKSNLLVVDNDCGKNPDAAASLSRLEVEHGMIPLTFTVKTKSDGYHYYLRGLGASSASRRLGAGLDSRSIGGYVVAPGCPGYEIVHNVAVAEAPGWLLQRLAPSEAREVETAVDLDETDAITRAIDFLSTAPPAIEGEGGDFITYRTACLARDYGVSEDTCLDLMLEHWNPRCVPLWDDAELATKVRNAYRYADSAAGTNNPKAIFQPFDAPPPPPRQSLFIDWADMRDQEIRIDYLVHGLIESPSTGMIFGDPSAGKSFTTIDLSCSVACGAPWFNGFTRPGIAVYFAGEGRHGVRRRIKAWEKFHDIQVPRSRLYVTQKRVEFTSEHINQVAEDLTAIQEHAGEPISLVVIDTLDRHVPAGSDENSSKDMRHFVNTVDAMRDAFNCVVCIVHHSGKMAKNDGRGSSAVKAAMDWQAKVENNKGQRSIMWTKQKDGETPAPSGFTLEDVEISEGVTSAVPIPCQFNTAEEKARDLGPDAALALEVLQFAAGSGYIEEDDWRSAFYDRLGDSLAPASKRQKFGRARKKLSEAQVILYNGTLVSERPAENEDAPFTGFNPESWR